MENEHIPLFYHFAGRGKRDRRGKWTRVFQRTFTSRVSHLKKDFSSECLIPDNLEIIICHNHPTDSLVDWNLKQLGISNYKRLGEKITQWKNIYKPRELYEYLLNQDGPEYILHLDADDVLMTENPGQVLDRYLKYFDCEILFNAQKTSYPSSKVMTMQGAYDSIAVERIRRMEKFEEEKYGMPCCYFNGGCFIGRRTSVLEILKEVLELEGYLYGFEHCDQGPLREAHRRFYPRIQIDDQSRIFQIMFDTRFSEIKSAPPLLVKECVIPYLYESINSILWIIRNYISRLTPRIIKQWVRQHLLK
ncbi:MAG: hypothetical protein H6757_04315 [Candidatus Omnitrophica bacterium]|nr:hypothetical protein [Candidatus Omnitrophota bacterium]